MPKKARTVGIATNKTTGKTQLAGAVLRRGGKDSVTGSKKSSVKKTNIKRDNQSLVARGQKPLKTYIKKGK